MYMSELRFFLLGPPQIEHGEQPITLRSAKAVALLAYLALTNSPQTRERLATLLWPESLTRAAHKNLSNTLWTLRKTFDEDLIHIDNNCLTLANTVWTDVDHFENMAEALLQQNAPAVHELEAVVELYRGILLEGYTLWDAPEFEIWLTTEQARFHELYLRILDTLVTLHRTKGNWHALIPLAQQALGQDSANESVAQALMEAQARLGERRTALHTYDTLKAELAAELSIGPSAETEVLHDAILRGHLSGEVSKADNLKSEQLSSDVTVQPPKLVEGGHWLRQAFD